MIERSARLEKRWSPTGTVVYGIFEITESLLPTLAGGGDNSRSDRDQRYKGPLL
jgi:hypothetical protein